MRLRTLQAIGLVTCVWLAAPSRAAGLPQFGPTPSPGQPGVAGAVPAVAMPAGPVSVDVQAGNVVTVLKQLAAAARANLVFSGDIDRSLTITLHDAPFDQAVSLIARAAGLNVQRVDGGYVIGAGTEAIYRARYIRADRLMDSLKGMFVAGRLRVVTGPDEYYSPSLGSNTAGGTSLGYAGGGGSGFGSGGGGGTTTGQAAGAAPPGAIRTVLLSGDAETVEQALELCYELDRPRKQVRFSVKFTSFDYTWLRNFGVHWSWKQLSLKEQPDDTIKPPGQQGVFSFGRFTRDPLLIHAAITAAEDQGNHVLKSVPSITVLDGELGHILIGEKHLYPKLVGYTQAQTPIYDKEQVNIGISLDLGVKVTDANDIILTLYPQVSQIIGYLETDNGSYPQISTLEQKTTVHVRDGETIVIGGLLNDETVDRTRGIPGLMKLPLLGKLFSYQDKETRKQDVVILIQAEIIKEDDR